MKHVSMLCFLTIFFVLFSGCKKIKCEAFDEKRAMFIPTNMVLNDSIIFYSNYGDSVTFYFDSKTMSEPEEYSACDKCACSPTLEINFRSKIRGYMSYILDDYSERANRICFQLIYSYGGTCAYAYFDYNPASNPATVSIPIEDGVLVNGVYYKDVVILTADTRFDKVYVAKDMGVIMATIKNSDVVWTINKPQ